MPKHIYFLPKQGIIPADINGESDPYLAVYTNSPHPTLAPPHASRAYP